MNNFYNIFVLLLGLNFIEGKSFRCDYKYSDVANGWFKHHTYPATWWDARIRCTMEGAELASPTTPEMFTEMKRIIGNNKKVFIGVHSVFSQGDFYTISGTPISDLKLNWSNDEPYNIDGKENCITFNDLGEIGDSDCFELLPYLCYRSANIKTEANKCGTVDPVVTSDIGMSDVTPVKPAMVFIEYRWESATKKCYKFHSVPRNFSRAFLVCSAEGGHLVIINNEKEHTVLKKIFTKFPSATMKGSMEKDLAYIGFHSWDETWDWRTIHGQTLSEAGFSRFKSGQPDNKAPGEYCGALHRLGELSDYYCEGKPAPFICEKDPDIPAVCEVPNLIRSRNQKQLKPKQRQVQPKRRQLQLKQSQLQQKTKMSKLK